MISIIGILVALLLPSVQAARGAARRASCSNNLKQLILGIHNYESAFKQLPAGYHHKFGPAGPLRDANHEGFAWGSMILPQIEQPGLFSRFDFGAPVFDPVNLEARETSIPTFLCPSDTYSDGEFVVRDDASTPIERYAACSYAANWGPSTSAINLDDTPLESDGVFYRKQQNQVAGHFGWLVEHAGAR